MSFQIHVQPSGHTFTAEADENILDAALRQGLNFPYSCRSGTCGTCKARLLEGRVEYPGVLPSALSAEEQAAGMALLCQARACTGLTLEGRELASGDIKPRRLPCRVIKVEQLAHDVMRVFLRLPADERLQFLAGQYIDILLKDGRHRSFSIANPPHDDEFIELHIRHVSGGTFSDYVFSSLKEKELLRFEGPHGSFFLREDSDRPILLLAGGTGFAPIKGIIQHAFAAGITRPMHFYWGARARRDLYLDDLPRNWAREHRHFTYTPVLSEPMTDDEWHGKTGYVPAAVLADHPDVSGYDIYASGPPVMVRSARDTLVAAGLPAEHFFSDPFEYSADARAQGAEAKD